jgi:hypothetical protein
MRFFKKAAIVMAVIAGLLVVGSITASLWLRARLQDPIALGDAELRLFGPSILPYLGVSLDSLHYASPSAEITAASIVADPAWIRSLRTLEFSVEAEAETAVIRLKEQTRDQPVDTAVQQILPDTIPFPEFSLPVLGSIDVSRILVLRDTTRLLETRDVTFRLPDQNAANLSIDRLTLSPADSLALSLRAHADWSAPGDIVFSALVTHENDSVVLRARHEKENLLYGSDSLYATIESSAPYLQILDSAPALPRLSQLQLRSGLLLQQDKKTLQFSLRTRASDLSTVGLAAAGAQRVVLELNLDETSGRWRLRTDGEGDSNIRLSGLLHGIHLPAYPRIDKLLANPSLSGSGKVSGLPIRMGEQTVRAGGVLDTFRVNQQSAITEVRTVDGSRVQGSASWDGQAVEGRYRAQVAPGERWAKAFVDTNVVYRQALVEGTFGQEGTDFTSRLADVVAWGIAVDSVFAEHTAGPQGYELRSGTLFTSNGTWAVQGFVSADPSAEFLRFEASHAAGGRLVYAMPNPQTMRVRAQRVRSDQLPVTIPLDTAFQAGITDADFAWNMSRDTGHAFIDATGNYQGARIEAEASAAWGADTFSVQQTRIRLGESVVRVSGIALTDTLPFFALAQLPPEAIRSASLEAEAVDIGRIAGLFLEQSPVRTGELNGRLGYTAQGGLDGKLALSRAVVQLGEERLSLQPLVLRARGDSISLAADLAYSGLPAQEEEVRVRVTDALDPEDSLALKAAVTTAGRFRIGFAGQLARLQRLSGRLTASGALRLPSNAGSVHDLDLDIPVTIPFAHPLDSLSIGEDTVRMTYVVARVDTQRIEAVVQASDGIVRIPALRIRGREDQQLQGQISYSLVEGRLLQAELSGERFAFRWLENVVLLEDLEVALSESGDGLTARARVERARATYYQGLLTAQADLRQLRVQVSLPQGEDTTKVGPENGPVPSVTASALLSSTDVRYRIASFDALQQLFQTQPAAPRGYDVAQPVELDITISTRGEKNRIATDVAQLTYTGNVDIRGTWPYPLLNGRISGLDGTIGISEQAYELRQLQVKWVNEAVGQGQVDIEAFKQLAQSCEPEETDSCMVFTQLDGTLEDLQFSYETNCGGEFGAGANITALVLSVRRGCYSPELGAGQTGVSLGEQALALLEPQLSGRISELTRELTGQWIVGAEITGLGALLADSVTQPISVELTSRKFLGLRLRARAGYRLDIREAANPWEYLLGLAWQPPLEDIIESPFWKRQLVDNLLLEASIESDPEADETVIEDAVRRRVGLIYRREFWKLW